MGFGSMPVVPKFLRPLAWALGYDVKEERPRPADLVSESFIHIWNERARVAYEAYGASVDWKNFAGQAMPQWPELPRRIQAAWCISIQTVYDTYITWEDP